MKFLGIDYGTKKIGLADSDEGGEFAFPSAVIKNDKKVIGAIGRFCRERKIEAIVLGEPLGLSGEQNEIMFELGEFKKALQREVGLPIHMEKEFMTSTAARHLESYMKGVRPDTARKTKASSAQVDDSAAAMILQRYLDKLKNNEF